MTAPTASWDEIRSYFADTHRQGEHVSFEGPTGSGKTTLAIELLVARSGRETVDGRPSRITVLETKRRDATMEALLGLGWNRVASLDRWPPAYGEERSIVWPPAGTVSGRMERMRPIFRTVLDEIESSGSQILFIDEVADFTDALPEGFGLKAHLTRYWRAARSNKVSLFGGTQRPVTVPRLMWSEPYWLFLFRPEDEDDLKRVAELSGSKQLVLDVLPTLDTHQFLMLRRRPERVAAISEVELA